MLSVLSSHKCVARVLRLLAALAAIPSVWACSPHTLAPPTGPPITTQAKAFPVGMNRDLDLLFMVDNSRSMKGLQAKMAQRLPDFMQVLKGLPGGLPNLHVAVVSSSLGTGNVNNTSIGCPPTSPGDDDGRFQHAATCTALNPGERFIKSIGGQNNFAGDIADVFACIAQLGDGGCGIEQQFQSTRRALEKALNDNDPDNGGFLRKDAILGVIMLTNEDDCSVDYESTLFDNTQFTLKDPLGGLQNYRCNEFGHLCDGVAPPHEVSAPMTLNNCVPAEDKGRLVRVADFVKFLQQVQPDPGKLFVAALAGEPGPYVVKPEAQQLINGAGSEIQPSIEHSCQAPDNPIEDFADPGVRVAAFVKSFPESNGKFASICDQDFKPAMEDIARALSRLIQPPCLNHAVGLTEDGHPNCTVAISSGDKQRNKEVPECTTGGTAFPCWRLEQAAACPVGGQLSMCWEATCDASKAPPTNDSASVTCVVAP